MWPNNKLLNDTLSCFVIFIKEVISYILTVTYNRSTARHLGLYQVTRFYVCSSFKCYLFREPSKDTQASFEGRLTSLSY